MTGKSWLRCSDRDGNQHVLWLPESSRHTLTIICACRPKIDRGVIVHAVITSAYVPQSGREREH